MKAAPFPPIRRRLPFSTGAQESPFVRDSPWHRGIVLDMIERLLGDSAVTDVLVSPSTGIWIDDGRMRQIVHDVPESEARRLAETLLARGGRHIDYLTPMADARLAQGVRVHAVLAPVASSGTTVSIRVARHADVRLTALKNSGFVNVAQHEALIETVRGRGNILISGATGTGKTTLLSALLAEVPHDERIVIIEDVTELRPAHPHVVSLESRQANTDGRGSVGLGQLVREALRMRPDRIVVGECRGPELLDFLTALNTGHSGGGVTVHANSLHDVPQRLEALAEAHGLPPAPLARLAVSAIDLVVHLERVGGARRVATLGRLSRERDGLVAVPLLENDELGSASPR